jgi:predicted AlkP superfamily phosphohydrolase/phosphomutase
MPMAAERRVLVIGLDGVPWDLVRRWTAEGVMPVLASLIERGAGGPLASTVPPTSAPAWSSFLTGMNPGKTGVWDFLGRADGSYRFPPVDARGRSGTVVIFNVPMTWPVEPVDGVMVSGWMTPPGADGWVHPPEVAAELAALGEYRITPAATFREKDRASFLAASHELLRMRTRAALHLMETRSWDLFVTVFFDTDRILHQLWHDLDPDHPWRQGDRSDRSGDLRDYFRALDASLGRLVAAAGEDTLVMVMSDHGMGPAHCFIVLNNWLLDQGFLVLRRGPLTRLKKALFGGGLTLRNAHLLIDRLGLSAAAEYRAGYFADRILRGLFLSFDDVDWSRTRAYSSGRMLGSVYLNVRGREPAGIVEPGDDYERTRAAIIRALEECRDPVGGERLTGRIARGEDLWSGPLTGRGPDIVAWPARETDVFFGLSDFGAGPLVSPVYRYSGMHRPDGFLVAAGPGVRPGGVAREASIVDLAPTILAAMGIPVPADMDGSPLAGLIETTATAPARPVSDSPEPPPSAAEPSAQIFTLPQTTPRQSNTEPPGAVCDGAPARSPRDDRAILEQLVTHGYLG